MMAPAEPDVPAIDYAQLEESTLGDNEFGRELTAIFVQQTQEQLARIRAAQAAGNAAALRALTHRLKGGASALGAGRLSAEAARLEEEAERGELGAAGGRVERLAAFFDEARRDLEHHFGVAAP